MTEDVTLKRKQFAAKVRSAWDALDAKHRRPYMGGHEVLSQEKRNALLGKQFGIPAHALGRYFTYSRNGICTHAWSTGVCKDCPSVDHLLFPKGL